MLGSRSDYISTVEPVTLYQWMEEAENALYSPTPEVDLAREIYGAVSKNTPHLPRATPKTSYLHIDGLSEGL